jgi:hypothetical protein
MSEQPGMPGSDNKMEACGCGVKPAPPSVSQQGVLRQLCLWPRESAIFIFASRNYGVVDPAQMIQPRAEAPRRCARDVIALMTKIEVAAIQPMAHIRPTPRGLLSMQQRHSSPPYFHGFQINRRVTAICDYRGPGEHTCLTDGKQAADCHR